MWILFGYNLLLFHTRLWDDLGLGLYDNWRLCKFRGGGGGWDDRWELDCPLLELVGELFVQEVTYHENCDDRNNVENIEWRLGCNLLNGGALGVINNWWDH